MFLQRLLWREELRRLQMTGRTSKTDKTRPHSTDTPDTPDRPIDELTNGQPTQKQKQKRKQYTTSAIDDNGDDVAAD